MGGKYQFFSKLILFYTLIFNGSNYAFSQNSIHLVKEIKGSISPKSIVYSGHGIFSAQNMMYRHTVTLYTTKGDLITTIEDKSNLKKYGFSEYTAESYMGGPVEACFSEKGKYLWVSNYSMVGKEFNKEGCDACVGDKFDPSFVYKINTQTNQIENVIKVGAVPKYLTINESTQKMVVTNWTSSDVSIIDLKTEKEIKRVKVGAHPRGVEITKNGNIAYVTVMGSTKIATINMETYAVDYITNVGQSPRHLVLDANDNYLYCSVNSSNKIVKIDLNTNERYSCTTKAGPRTMVLSSNQKYLYVVNYFTDSFQKVDAKTMTVIQTVETGHHPIGITANWSTGEIWVACYSGKIQIFKDSKLTGDVPLWPDFFDVKSDDYAVSYEPIVMLNPNEKSGETPVETPLSKIKKEIETPVVLSTSDVEPKLKIEKTVVKNKIESTPKIKTIPTYDSKVYFTAIKVTSTKKNTLKIIKKSVAVKENKIVEEVVEKPTKNISINSNGCSYHLIIGSFGLYTNALELQNKMINKGYAAQLIPSKNKKLTMVSIACFMSEADANNSKNKILKESQQNGWVYKN